MTDIQITDLGIHDPASLFPAPLSSIQISTRGTYLHPSCSMIGEGTSSPLTRGPGRDRKGPIGSINENALRPFCLMEGLYLYIL
jgi:hypothetical protein